jgi:hypothetical protein
MDLALYLDQSSLDLDYLRQTLETCGPWARRHAVRGIDRKHMAALYEASEGAEALTLDHFAPLTDTLQEVIHSGKNTLPAFNHFEKRFCKPDGDDPGEVLWGYNQSSVTGLVGPGYFTITIVDKGEAFFDYGKVPPRKVASWPAIVPGNGGIGTLVWGGLTDRMRKVSDHVAVGRAFKNGKAMDQWFMLCREDPKTT